MENTDIIPRGSVVSLVQQYEDICAMVEEAWSKLKQADGRLKQTLGGSNTYAGDLGTWKLDQELSSLQPTLKRKFWDHVITRSGVRNIMHHRVRAELDNQMRDDRTMPEFSVEIVQATLYGWAQNSEDVFVQMVQETFKAFLPGWWKKYKTNKAHRIYMKVIMEGAMDWFGSYVGQYSEQRLRDLDRVFHQMDGKTSPEYPHDIVSVINAEARLKNEFAESDYFQVRWFKNKNIHLVFKRLDLLAEFNRIGAGDSNAIGDE